MGIGCLSVCAGGGSGAAILAAIGRQGRGVYVKEISIGATDGETCCMRMMSSLLRSGNAVTSSDAVFER